MKMAADMSPAPTPTPAFPRPAADVDEIRRAYYLLIGPGRVTEIRIFKAIAKGDNYPKLWRGYFDSVEPLIAELHKVRAATGIFFLLNHANPALLARSCNRLTAPGKDENATADHDVPRRTLVLIDVDPSRPSGISATDAEKAHAFALIGRVRDYLAAAGWPVGALVDSGNGYHLYFAIDLPGDSDLIKRLLNALAIVFVATEERDGAVTELAKVDVTPANAARVTKLPGTLVCKGDHTPDRPHRVAHIIDAPDALVTVPTALLTHTVECLETQAQEIIDARPEEEKTPGKGKAKKPTPDSAAKGTAGKAEHKFDAGEWLQRHGFDFTGPERWTGANGGGRKWILSACPWNTDHVNASAYVLQFDSGAVSAGCHHDGCKGLGWKELRDLKEPDRYQGGEYTDNVSRLMTDIGNAARLSRRFADDLRFCFARGAWLAWTGKRWEWDTRGRAVSMAKQTALAIYDEARDEATLAAAATANGDEAAAARHGKRAAELTKWAVTSQKRERVMAMLAMAQPDMAIAPDELDADQTLINVQNGTVHVPTGTLRPHRRDDYLTKICSAAYRTDADAPDFGAFLVRIFRTQPALLEYTQRVLGYCSTGLNTEQAIFFLYGRGSNGKTTLIDAGMHVLGDYAGKADPDLLMTRDGAAHPCNVADLMGRRMVVCSETNEGKRFDEAKLKDLVGETILKARFMYGDFFQFRATHKVLMYSNHRPLVRGTDHGFWRRMKLVPFLETITDDEKDTNLPAKLQAEADGILSWIIGGAIAWHRDGITTPPEVIEATKAYRAEMDSIGLFLTERCIEGDKLIATARDLYASYSEWCEAAGESPLSQRRLGMTLSERGFESGRCSATGRAEWRGIGLKQNP